MSTIGRPCAVCSAGSDVRAQVDSAILSGTSFRDVAGRFELSKSAVHRHALAHFAPEVRAAFEQRSTIDVPGLVLRFAEIAEDLEEASDLARANGNAKDIARVADSRLRVWGQISDRLGIDADDVRGEAERILTLWYSVRALLREHPDLQTEFVAELRTRPQGTFLAQIVEKEETKEIEN